MLAPASRYFLRDITIMVIYASVIVYCSTVFRSTTVFYVYIFMLYPTVQLVLLQVQI